MNLRIYKQFLWHTVFALACIVAVSAVSDENVSLNCNESGDCLSSNINCHKICGCDRSELAAMTYNETSKTCVLNFKNLMFAKLKVYGNSQSEINSADADTMEGKISAEAEKIFNTILISVILFLTCCTVCVVSACLYCCRISYCDYKLKKDVKALAKKLQRDHKTVKPSKKPREPAHESCNVICEDAGVFVV